MRYAKRAVSLVGNGSAEGGSGLWCGIECLTMKTSLEHEACISCKI